METIKEILVSFIGEYSPDLSAEGIAQIDFVWIVSAILFIGLIFGFFKAVRFILGVVKP